MATSDGMPCITLAAASDLSTKQYYAVKLNSSAQVELASTGEQAIGILYDKPSAAGAACAVRPFDGRVAYGFAGGTIAAGDLLKVNSAGKLVAAQKAYTNTSDGGAAQDALVGSNVIGIALESAVASDIFSFLGYALGAVPTTAA